MRLHKDIFKVTKENKVFLRHLYHHPGFMINEIIKEFSLTYGALFNHLQEWEANGFIVKERMPPKLGAVKFKYSLSEKAIKELKEIWDMDL